MAAGAAAAARQAWNELFTDILATGIGPTTVRGREKARQNFTDQWDGVAPEQEDLPLRLRDARTEVQTAQQAVDATANYPTLVAGEPTPRYSDSEALGDEPSFQEHLDAQRQLLEWHRVLVSTAAELVAVMDGLDVTKYSRNFVASIRTTATNDSAAVEGEIEDLEPLLPEHEEAQKRAFQRKRDDLSLGSSWVGGWSFAPGGSFGAPSLWVKQSPAGAIVDRVVVKESHFMETPEKIALWEDEDNNWRPDPRDPSKLIPCEVLAMYNLRGRIGSENVLMIRNWRVASEEMMHRIYLEFCPYGDLEQYAGWYDKQFLPISNDAVAVQEFHRTRDERERMFLPEPFLWHTFESLAIAGLLMEKGEIHDGALSAWDLLIHLDYKPANVFLGMPSADRFKGYPIPKLGDFGFCMMFPQDDTRTSADIPDRGSLYSRAPEQMGHTYRADGIVPMIDSKTNVYGVGMVLWSLLELEAGDHRMRWEGEECEDGNENDPDLLDEANFRPVVVGRYSQQLRELILQCVRYNQTDRPMFKEILRRIRLWTSRESQSELEYEAGVRTPGAVDLAFGLRDAPESSLLWRVGPHVLEHKADKWPLLASLGGIAPPKGMTPFLPAPGRVAGDDDEDDDDEDDEDDEEDEEDDDDRPGGPSGAEVEEKRKTFAGKTLAGKTLPGKTPAGKGLTGTAPAPSPRGELRNGKKRKSRKSRPSPAAKKPKTAGR